VMIPWSQHLLDEYESVTIVRVAPEDLWRSHVEYAAGFYLAIETDAR